jgi:LysM repeat protein
MGISFTYFFSRSAAGMVLFFFCLSGGVLTAQEYQKSEKIEIVEGKKYYVHTVEKSQTLFGIAKTYNTSVSDILSANPAAIDGLQPGQTLNIPYVDPLPIPGTKQENGKPIENKSRVHKVEKGETWYGIAKKYNVTVEQLKSLNLDKKDNLQPGDELRLPSLAFHKETTPQVKGNSVVVPENGSNGQKTSFWKNSDSLVKKDKYHVAILLPFNLSQISEVEPEKIKNGFREFPGRSKISIEFYRGVLLALDSLTKMGLKTEVSFYDTGSDSTSAGSFLKVAPWKTFDLIIGPFYLTTFQQVAKIAQENKIPLVSPTLQNNKILLGNPWVIKTEASYYTQSEQLGYHVGQKYKGENILLVNPANPKEATFVSAFRKKANEVLLAAGADSVKTVQGLGGAMSGMVKGKRNVVVFPSNSQSAVTDFIGKLYKYNLDRKDSIILVGLNSWAGFDNIDPEYLSQLNVIWPSNYFVNYSDSLNRRIISAYREKYNTEPSEFFYKGFDLSLFFISGLHARGNHFLQGLPENHGSGIGNRFKFESTGPDSGLENTGVHILYFRNYHQFCFEK